MLMVGGSGNVGRSVVSSLLKVGECERVILVLRKQLHLGNPRVHEIVIPSQTLLQPHEHWSRSRALLFGCRGWE